MLGRDPGRRPWRSGCTGARSRSHGPAHRRADRSASKTPLAIGALGTELCAIGEARVGTFMTCMYEHIAAYLLPCVSVSPFGSRVSATISLMAIVGGADCSCLRPHRCMEGVRRQSVSLRVARCILCCRTMSRELSCFNPPLLAFVMMPIRLGALPLVLLFLGVAEDFLCDLSTYAGPSAYCCDRSHPVVVHDLGKAVGKSKSHNERAPA